MANSRKKVSSRTRTKHPKMQSGSASSRSAKAEHKRTDKTPRGKRTAGKANRNQNSAGLGKTTTGSARTRRRNPISSAKKSKAPAQPANVDCTPSRDIRSRATAAVASKNPTEAVVRALRSPRLTPRETFLFLREVAACFLSAGNKLVASGFLEEASHHLDALPEAYRRVAVKDLLTMGLSEEAFEVALRGIGTHTAFTVEERKKLGAARDSLREKIYNAKGHGQEVLLTFLASKAEALRRANGTKPPVLIEIGTTRESASGQGSTRRFMEFCRKNGFHFITVDMDSANVQMADQMFRQNDVLFEAVHAKGEDYLADYEGGLDCVFLDAYDFDHGKHSELRQSRYEKFLGTRINDADCHKMHLDCARTIVKKLHPWTLVCMDDTWLDAGQWTAKGTLSMPYFLENGLRLLDVRNRSALLGGPAWLQSTTR
jgi:predicted O-methyltransferase YrrM